MKRGTDGFGCVLWRGTREVLEATSVKSAKCQKNAVRREVANALQVRLEAMMRTEKPWLENELTLTQLATSLQASPHHLSQVINEVLGKTFYDYINECRVCEVQRCLRDPAYDGQPILDIALASGFNSKQRSTKRSSSRWE